VDKKGALRIAIASFAFGTIVWIGRVHPIPSADMISLCGAMLGDALLYAAMVWLLYLALEPAARSRWPHAIVTWNRILAGRWKDAQVGSHILIGAALGTAIWVLLAIPTSGPKNTLQGGIDLWPLLGTRQWVASGIGTLNAALIAGLLAFFAIFGLRALLKKDWLAAIAASVLFTFSEGQVVTDPNWMKLAAIYVASYAVLMFVLLRVGLVTTISMIFFINAIGRICLGADFKAWWAPHGFASMALLLGIAAYAFWRSIGTRPSSINDRQ